MAHTCVGTYDVSNVRTCVGTDDVLKTMMESEFRNMLGVLMENMKMKIY